MKPETFSSEIGDVHERRGDRPSFTNEFHGASDSLIEADRPPRILDAGRRGRRLMLGIILVAAVLVGGGWSLWYWSAPIGAWIAGLGPDRSEPTPEPDPAVVAPAVEPEPLPPPSDEPEKVFGIRGGSGEPGSSPDPQAPGLPVEPPAAGTDTAGAELPVEPQTLDPVVAGTNIQATATDVRGKVSRTAVATRLALVDAALPSCWTAAITAGAKGPVEVELSLVIRWSGSANSIRVTGGSAALGKCVREAVPTSGWPKPSDGGDAKVTRHWTFGAA